MIAWGWLAVAGAAEADLRIVAEDFDLHADTERSLRRVLHRMFRSYQDELGLAMPDPTRVHVRLVADRADYDRRASASGLDKPTLGFFSSRLGEGVVWRNTSTDTMRATIVHEASHYLMTLGGAGNVPLWIHEGMAELFEGARTSGNAVYLDPPAGLGSWLRASADALPPLSQLLGGDEVWTRMPQTPVGPAEYGVGWSLCAFLMSSPTGKEALAAVMQQTRGGRASAAATAVEQHYPGGIAALDREWRAWIGRPLTSIQMPIPTAATSESADPGWIRCRDGSLIRQDSGMQCGRWVPGANGVMTFELD